MCLDVSGLHSVGCSPPSPASTFSNGMVIHCSTSYCCCVCKEQGARRDSERVIPCTYGQSRTAFIRSQSESEKVERGVGGASRQQEFQVYSFCLSSYYLLFLFQISGHWTVVTGSDGFSTYWSTWSLRASCFCFCWCLLVIECLK